MLRLRPYTPSDASTILSWTKDETTFYQWTAGVLGEYPITEEQFNIVSNLMAFAAIDDNETVGFFTMRRPNESFDELRFGFVIVDPEKRGQGYGKRMLQLGLVYAKDIFGAKKVSLGVFENNEQAYHCYKAAGFRDVFPKSSMPSVDDFYQVFKKSAKEQIPVICICITRKFSGSLQSAIVAKEMIEEEYPDAKITLIDSTVNTVLQGLFVLEACRLRDMGLEYEEIVEKILPIRETGRIFFTIGSIDYLRHGGRIGKLAGIAAGALGIKPMITLKEGEIFSSGLARNRIKSMKRVVDMTKNYLDEIDAKPGEYDFCIGYGYDYDEAVRFREMIKDLIKERLGIDEIGIYQIGATIGVHTGSYPLGVGIIKKAEV